MPVQIGRGCEGEKPTGSPLAIVLLYTTGLRRGELVRLRIGDYEPYQHTLLVREFKFHKFRLVTLSPDTIQKLEVYLNTGQAKGFTQ